VAVAFEPLETAFAPQEGRPDEADQPPDPLGARPPAVSPASPDVTAVARYDIVPDRSEVWIDATSPIHPIHSHTRGLEGFVDLEVHDGRLNLTVPPKGQMSLPVERLQSGNPLEDRELRRRIDARRYRTIDGRLLEVRETGTRTRYLVRGDVTFKGVTNTYEGEMTIDQVDDKTLTLEGRSTFDIREFGMEPPRILMLRVDPEVAVRVEIVAARKG
jgi:polyisoprenoid-binding protein YceI